MLFWTKLQIYLFIKYHGICLTLFVQLLCKALREIAKRNPIWNIGTYFTIFYQNKNINIKKKTKFLKRDLQS